MWSLVVEFRKQVLVWKLQVNAAFRQMERLCRDEFQGRANEPVLAPRLRVENQDVWNAQSRIFEAVFDHFGRASVTTRPLV